MSIKNMELTTSEKLLLKHWRAHQKQFGGPPSLSWCANIMGVARNSIVHMRKRLKAKGWLREETVTQVRLTLSAKARRSA